MNEVTILAPNEVVEQLEASERLPQDIDPDTLRYFTLTQPDLGQVDQCRGATNKLGFAVQLCTLRWRGHFLRDTREIPEPVLETLSLQLGVLPMPIDDYPQNEITRFDHLERIRQHLKFSRCDASQRESRDQVLFKIAPSPGVRHGYVSRFQALVQGCQQRRLVVRPGSNQCPELSLRTTCLTHRRGRKSMGASGVKFLLFGHG